MGGIFGMLIGLHILGRIFSGDLYTEGVLTGFYGMYAKGPRPVDCRVYLKCCMVYFQSF